MAGARSAIIPLSESLGELSSSLLGSEKSVSTEDLLAFTVQPDAETAAHRSHHSHHSHHSHYSSR
jgi:hypothetical protein